MDVNARINVWMRRLGRPNKKEILEGDILPLLFKLGWPMMLGSMLQTTYNLIDTIWLGRLPVPLNTQAVAAISLAWPFVFLMISIELGLGVAGVAMISQHTGAKRYEEAYQDAGQLFFLFMILSVILGVLGYFTAEPFLNLLTGNSPVVGPAIEYLVIIFIGFPFFLIFGAFSMSLRAWGDTITPTAIMSISVLLNILLDPILIFGIGPFPFMGIKGAALATVFSQAVASIFALYLLFSGKLGLKVNLEYMKPDIRKIKKFFKIGIPATAARIFDASEFVIFVGILAMLPMHEEVLAAYGIGNRIINITFVILWGLGVALTTVVGQSLGADKIIRADESAKRGMIVMAGLMTLISLILVIFRYPLINFFIKDQPDVVNIGAMFLLVLAIGGPFFAIFEGVTATLNGSGHTKQQLGLSITRLWILRLPLAVILALILALNSTGAWLAIAFSNVIAGSAAYVVYKRGWWKEKVIEKKPLV